jgi:hypothetical protein
MKGCAYDEDEIFTELLSWIRKRDPSLPAEDYVNRLALDPNQAELCILHQPWPMDFQGVGVTVEVEPLGEALPLDSLLVEPVPVRTEPKDGEIYWVSISSSGFRRLHRVSGCSVNRAQCGNWNFLTSTQAVSQKSDRPCLLCWPELKGALGDSSSDESGEESSSSSESEGEGDQINTGTVQEII